MVFLAKKDFVARNVFMAIACTTHASAAKGTTATTATCWNATEIKRVMAMVIVTLKMLVLVFKDMSVCFVKIKNV